MPKGYHHLTYEQRCQIEALKGILPQSEIAKIIGVHPTTISREVSRNGAVHGGYFFKIANKLTNERRRLASRRPRKLYDADLQYIKARLRERWSPEQIAGYCKVNGIMSISHESVYKFIWKDKKGDGTLHTCLRHRGKKYHKRGAKTAGRGLIPNRVGIEDRPKIVETKSRKGDFEGDTIIGAAQRGVIMSHVDRHSKYTKLTLLPDRTVKSIFIGIKQSLEPLKDGLHTITYDNGMEFAGHAEISKLLGARLKRTHQRPRQTVLSKGNLL